MKRIGAYIRVSTEKQAQEGSHERQKETVEKWVAENVEEHFDIIFYQDIAESGQNLSREAHEQMMEESQDLDMVLVRELSRFGRNMRKMLNDIETLEDNNCDFISIKDEQINTSTAQGKLLFHIIGAFNQFWADIARERSEEMIQRRREEGKTIGRERKLSEEQISELWGLREEKDLSYSTLARIAESKNWCETISKATIYQYFKKVENGEIDI